MRGDSTWNQLAPERRREFDRWLFQERVSYGEAVSRAKQQWGVQSSISSVGNYYRRMLKVRGLEEAVGLRDAAEAVADASVKTELLRESTMKLVGKRFFKETLEEGDVNELRALARLLKEAEERDLRREQLALAQERLELDAAKATLAKELDARQQMIRERMRMLDANPGQEKEENK